MRERALGHRGGMTTTTSQALSTIEAARAEFDSEVVYLNTATVGLPLRRSWLALQAAQDAWRAGTADPVTYDEPLTAARAAYARLVQVQPSDVAVGSQVSVFAGLVAASVPDGSEILTVTPTHSASPTASGPGSTSRRATPPSSRWTSTTAPPPPCRAPGSSGRCGPGGFAWPSTCPPAGTTSTSR